MLNRKNVHLLGSNIRKLKNPSKEYKKLKKIKLTSPKVFTFAFFVAITSNLAPMIKITIARKISLAISMASFLLFHVVLY